YEIEKGLIEGSIPISEVEEAWNTRYEHYLGLRPEHISEGVLQDIHWSMGALGYFPTYSTGSVLSAQLRFYMEKELGRIDGLLSLPQGVKRIQTWLSQHIHRHGATYPFAHLVKNVTGEEFTSTYWQEYIREKYT